MKVFLTETAEECLWAIWDHDRLYSESLADRFQRDIDRFIRDAIAANPEIGHLWHTPRGIRRLIFRRRHNIFYALRGDAAARAVQTRTAQRQVAIAILHAGIIFI